MFSKMTKGQLIALTAILKMNKERTSGVRLSTISKGNVYGTELQLANVVFITVHVIHVFCFRSSCCSENEKLYLCGKVDI